MKNIKGEKEKIITITARRKYPACNGWIGSGIVSNATAKEDVIGFRIKKDRKVAFLLDLTIQEALDLSWTLSKAVGDYFLQGVKYFKNPVPKRIYEKH